MELYERMVAVKRDYDTHVKPNINSGNFLDAYNGMNSTQSFVLQFGEEIRGYHNGGLFLSHLRILEEKLGAYPTKLTSDL